MGIHISIYRLGEYDEDGYIEETNVSKELGWDVLRVSGDSDFINDVSFDFKGDHISNPERYYRRPISFEDAFEWQNTREVNKTRFIDILNKMKADPSLWFSVS